MKTVSYGADTKSYKNEADALQKGYEVPVNFQTCVLTSLLDWKRFREFLNSATFLVEIHHENLHQRAFSSKNIEEFNVMLSSETAPVAAVAPTGAL